MVVGAAVVAVGALAACLRLYVFPAHDEPRDVDAVYVIGPPTDARMAVAEDMIARGMSDTLVISLVEDDARDRARWKRAAELCDSAGEQPFSVLCSQPDPFTTRGEARWLRALADERGWESAAVITITPHLTRARVIMRRCWDGDIAYVDSGERLAPWYWLYHFAYQSAAFVKVSLEDGC